MSSFVEVQKKPAPKSEAFKLAVFPQKLLEDAPASKPQAFSSSAIIDSVSQVGSLFKSEEKRIMAIKKDVDKLEERARDDHKKSVEAEMRRLGLMKGPAKKKTVVKKGNSFFDKVKHKDDPDQLDPSDGSGNSGDDAGEDKGGDSEKKEE